MGGCLDASGPSWGRDRLDWPPTSRPRRDPLQVALPGASSLSPPGASLRGSCCPSEVAPSSASASWRQGLQAASTSIGAEAVGGLKSEVPGRLKAWRTRGRAAVGYRYPALCPKRAAFPGSAPAGRRKGPLFASLRDWMQGHRGAAERAGRRLRCARTVLGGTRPGTCPAPQIGTRHDSAAVLRARSRHPGWAGGYALYRA